MSQQQIFVSDGALPPDVPLEFITDFAAAVPFNNQIEIHGSDDFSNNLNGVFTINFGVNNNKVIIVLSNRIRSANPVETTDANPTNIATSPALSDGVYTFDFTVSGYKFDAPQAGIGLKVFGTIKVVSGVATVIGIPDGIKNKDAALNTADATIIASGNTAILQVTGVAATNINWFALGTYTEVA